jgi:hypothetical protein
MNNWTGNYVSLDRILEKVFQDIGYEHEMDWNDTIEWVGEALRLIGAPSVYITKVSGIHPLTPHVVITSYKGELPIDFNEMLPGGCRDFDTNEVYRYATDTFVIAPGSKSYNTTTNKPESRSELNTNDDKVYSLNDSYIFVNTESCTLELAYRAIKIDDRGFPMVPDNERVIKCIESNIVYHNDYRLWRKNKLSETIFRHSEKEWLFYVGSAGNAMRNMHPDKKESWTKALIRLNPVINSHMSSFKFAGNQEDLNIGS